ncbi:hypothetical protein DIE22_23505 [Burkholderia sp. Bp9142]|nr:hypothetical protein DIE22_23505 [Burkholderia sp. Bp9142]
MARRPADSSVPDHKTELVPASLLTDIRRLGHHHALYQGGRGAAVPAGGDVFQRSARRGRRHGRVRW